MTQTERNLRAIEEIDKIKYIPESEPYCKILVNGQEPDTRGVKEP